MTNNIGISQLIEELVRFYRDVALLLKTVDGYLFDLGWDRLGENNGHRGFSRSVENPENWMPKLFYRIYCSKGYPNLMAFVSIALVEKGTEHLDTDAVLTVGFVDYGEGNKPTPSGWNWSDLESALWYEDGFGRCNIVIEIPEARIKPNDHAAKRICYMYQPLANISDRNQLANEVLEPLKSILTEYGR